MRKIYCTSKIQKLGQLYAVETLLHTEITSEFGKTISVHKQLSKTHY